MLSPKNSLYTPLPAPDPFPAPPQASADPAAGDLLTRVAQAGRSFQDARAASTLRAYAHDWNQFRVWCAQNHLLPLPASPQTVILYSTDLVKNRAKKLNTLSRRL